MSSFSDADFQKAMHASVRLGLIFTVVGAVVLLITRGWASALMFVVGALISTTGVWEWRRLMTAVAWQMDNAADQQNTHAIGQQNNHVAGQQIVRETASKENFVEEENGRTGLQPGHLAGQTEGALAPEEPAAEKPRMGFVLAVFFLRLGVTVAVLYVTLKYLQGSVFALAAGLLVGVLALLIQAFRLLRSWTV